MLKSRKIFIYDSLGELKEVLSSLIKDLKVITWILREKGLIVRIYHQAIINFDTLDVLRVWLSFILTLQVLCGIFLLIAFFFFPIVLFVLLRWLLRHYGLAALMPMKDVIPSV